MQAQSGLFRAVWAGYFLAGMHFFMHNPGGVGLSLPYNAWGWIFASLLIGAGLWRITQLQSVLVPRLWTWLLAGVALMFVPLAYPGFEFKAHASERLLGLAAGLLFLLCLYQWRFDRAQRSCLLYWVLAAAGIEILLGLVQYFVLGPGNWMGYDVLTNRPNGIFNQRNLMGSFLATGLALGMWQCARDPRDERWRTCLRYGIVCGAGLLLILGRSRTGLFGGMAAFMLLAPLLYRTRPDRFKWLCFWLAGGVLCGFVAPLLLSALQSAAPSEIALAASATAGPVGGSRDVFWPFILKLISQNFWLGYGYGSFESVFLERFRDYQALNPGLVDVIDVNLDHPHNELLFWAMEGGVAPLLGLLLMAGAFVWRIGKAGWPLRLAMLGLVAPILLHTQTEFPFYQSIVHWWLFLLLVYIADIETEEATAGASHDDNARWPSYPLRQRLLMGFLALAVPLLAVPYMLSALHTNWVVVRYEREGYRNPLILLQIVNPLPMLKRVELNIYTLRLRTGLKTGDRAQLEAYLAWGKSFVRHTPRESIYWNMALALRALGKAVEAQALLKQAAHLYPALANPDGEVAASAESASPVLESK